MKWAAEGGKGMLWIATRKGLCERKACGLRKRTVFSAHAKPPKMKSFFQHTTATTSHRTKANVQLQILSAKAYCELAVYLLFFEKHPSCVCTAVTLSHRFKAFTPPFCRQNRFRHVPPEFSAKFLPTEL